MNAQKYEFDGLTFESGFLGASLGSIERLGKDWYHLNLRQDTWFWFNFKLEGASKRKIIFQIRDRTPEMEKICGYWTRHINEDNTAVCHKPMFSYNQKDWHRFEHSEQDFHEPDLIRFSNHFEKDSVWICYGIPYPPERWQKFMQQFKEHPHIKETTLGFSRLGYSIDCLTITDFSIPETNKKIGWILCREDQAETTGALALEGGMEILMSPEAADIRKQLIVNIVPMVSIDGIMCGSPFSGGYGYLTGRWQDAVPPAEIIAIKRTIDASHRLNTKIAFAGKLHGSVSWDNNNYVTNHEKDKTPTYFFAQDEKAAKILCQFLPAASLQLTLDRLGIRPRGRFERYIYDNYKCDIIFASEIHASTQKEAREQGKLIFKALLSGITNTSQRELKKK